MNEVADAEVAVRTWPPTRHPVSVTARPTRPPLNGVQRRTMMLTVAILLAGAITFVVVGHGFVVALSGVCATIAVVVGMGIDFLRR